MLGSAGGGFYLHTKSAKFKEFGKGLKTLIIAGLAFVFLFGIGFFNYDPQLSEQQRIAAEKAKIEQQQNNENAKKQEEAKKAEEDKKAEEAKKQAAEKEKANALAKFNLKEVWVSRVVDGDIIELSDGSKVRFIGVNTPESTTRTEPYGKEASDYIKKQLTNKTVYIEKDVSETDKYGRLLRYVWLDIPKEISDTEIKTKMFNAILVSEGYGEVSTYSPDVKYQEYFTRYNSEARTASKGLWAINPNGTTKGDTTVSNATSNTSSTSVPVLSSSTGSSSGSGKGSSSENSSKQSGGEFIITATGKKYHRPGCRTIKQIKSTVSREEAESMGYGPCGVCHP
ncbi:MAG: nuclease [Clostridiaceae bacterium]|nr:nuclease [Clostridiaceae bacterium]